MSNRDKHLFEDRRKEFDRIEKAPADMWAKISAELPAESESKDESEKEEKKKGKVIRFPSWLRAAAMFLVIFGAGFIAAKALNQTQSSDEIMANKYPEMFEAERYYSSNIMEVKNELIVNKDVDKALVDEFMKEHELLDRVYLELKDMLNENRNSDRVIELMLGNLQMRLEVLLKQKKILQNIKSIKSGKHETKTL